MTTANTGSSAGSVMVAGLVGGLAAAVANYLLYFASSAAGVSFAGEFGPDVASLPVPAIGISSIVPALPAGLVALGLRELASGKAATIFGVLSIVLCVLSFGGPYGIKGLGTGGLVVMELMHVVAAVGIGGALWRKLSRG